MQGYKSRQSVSVCNFLKIIVFQLHVILFKHARNVFCPLLALPVMSLLLQSLPLQCPIASNVFTKAHRFQSNPGHFM